MKEIYLDSHAGWCEQQKTIDKDMGRFCELNPTRFLFFVGTKFYLVTYHDCMSYDQYDFKKEIVSSCIDQKKIFELYKVNRGVNIRDNLRDFRIRNMSLKKYIEQVNYIYSDNAGKEYAITTRTKYLDLICDQNAILESYIDAKEFLLKHNYNYLLIQLDKLYQENILFGNDDTETVKTIDSLINFIHKEIKQENGNN